MKSIHAIGIIIALTVTATSALADSTDTAAPNNVTVTIGGENALVSWVPGEGDFDKFNVYAWIEDAWVLIRSTTEPSAIVSSEFEGYAVSSSSGGIESELVEATQTCAVRIQPMLPPAYLEGCIPEKDTVVKVH